MTALARIAFIGNSLPRRCGIATFTTDLCDAVTTSRPDLNAEIVAMTDHGHTYEYPAAVSNQINDSRLEDYAHAAEVLNASCVDVVSLQHEFGIFGGAAGSHILTLLSRLTMPVVTTFHTVLAEPAPTQRSAMNRIIDNSSKIIVMAEKGRELLRSVYGMPANKIEVIPHGIPDFAFAEPDAAKAKFGFSGRTVLLTFGLLSPNKGIEVMIDAMPSILQGRPDAVYVVLGATHPNLVREQGEAYRNSLVAHVRQLGIEDHVVFLDRFVDKAMLLDFISMCDVYVSPYLTEAQMTSGTLAYSFGLGKPVVSTPYWHAQELLADNRGILVPFGDAPAIGREIAALLADETRRQAIRERAYAVSRSMTWERTAECYLDVFQNAVGTRRQNTIARVDRREPRVAKNTLLEIPLGHFLSMCDDTGLFQHATHSVPNRSHGYCVDDNARALLLSCALNRYCEPRLPEVLTARLAAFVQYAWNPQARRFRNFMGFDRCWLEDEGSEDSHGRTLWALGECARNDSCLSRRQWAAGLFLEALPVVEDFLSPRAWAFTLLGLDAYFAAVPANGEAANMRCLLAERLISILSSVETKNWVWFEEELAYDNARLPQALILTGMTLGEPSYVEGGLRALRWLMTMQTAPRGFFRPVGTESFGNRRTSPRAFDQQPLEAAATISACLAAMRADGDVAWKVGAESAFSWFMGDNDLFAPLVDLQTGSCRDGLHRDRANENRGGESVVSYLLSIAEMRDLDRMSEPTVSFLPIKAVHA